jgi:peptidyl-prolyl cis-trans isomerase SurA
MKLFAAGMLIAVVGVMGGPAIRAQAPAGPQAPAPGAAPAQGPAQPASAAVAKGKSTIVERVLVRVNGEIFTQSELTQRQVEELRRRNAAGLPDERLEAELATITPLILVEVVDDLLLVQRGREMGVKFTDERFNSSLEAIKKDNNLNDAQFKQALAAEGLTLEQLRQNLERAELRRAVQQREIGPSMTITQEEQRQYYAAHRPQFMTPETVTLRQLLIAVPARPGDPNQTPDQIADAAAKSRIGDLRAKAIGGADFAQLVKDNGDGDATAKANGGLVGPVNVDDLNPVLKDAILRLKPGEVSEPIRTPGGYQILKLETRVSPELRPFETVRSEVENAIRNERLEPETEKMLKRLRTGAVIEWKDENYRKMYETAKNQRDATSPEGPSAPPAAPVRQ